MNPSDTQAQLSAEDLKRLDKAAERFDGAYLDDNHPWRLLTADYCAVFETCNRYPLGAWLDGTPDDLALAFLALTSLKPLIAAARRALPSSEPSGAAESDLPAISLDGPHKPDDHRVWVARQLLDSRLTAEEAWSIAAYHPKISRALTTPAAPASAPGAGEAELRAALERVVASLRTCPEPLEALVKMGQTDVKSLVDGTLVPLARHEVFAKAEFPAILVKQALLVAQAALAAHSPSATASGGGE